MLLLLLKMSLIGEADDVLAEVLCVEFSTILSWARTCGICTLSATDAPLSASLFSRLQSVLTCSIVMLPGTRSERGFQSRCRPCEGIQ